MMTVISSPQISDLMVYPNLFNAVQNDVVIQQTLLSPRIWVVAPRPVVNCRSAIVSHQTII